MPPENESRHIMGTMGDLYIIDTATGVETPLGPVTQIRTVEADPREDKIIARLNPTPTATFTIKMPDKKMTRKRFVKKLMAAGVPRNIANSMAEIALIHCHSYAWSYFVISASGYLPWKED